jgi:hypothetical protein
MPWYRSALRDFHEGDKTRPTETIVRQVIDEVVDPANFFTAPTETREQPAIELRWDRAVEEVVSWELFRGCLLRPAHTRESRSFLAWNGVRIEAGERSGESLISVKLDRIHNVVHVVRSILSYVTEGYDAGGGVFQSREAVEWARELVGTIELDRLTTAELRDELAGLVHAALVGTSRLPLTSLESPLPDFSLGRLAYCFGSRRGASATVLDFFRDRCMESLSFHEQVKQLEFVLRAVRRDELDSAVTVVAEALYGSIAKHLRALFDRVALTPYTDFVDKVLEFCRLTVVRGAMTEGERIDFLGYVLRQVARHLTAYDLVTYHHFGANYPDALLLDAVLADFTREIDQRPGHFLSRLDDTGAVLNRKRLRRRALRQGWLLRRQYTGHLVPDRPTSAGENMRVLPAPHARVPEEQIRDATKRTRQLFDGRHAIPSQLTRQTLGASVADLDDPRELLELGCALFLDRPMGRGKHPMEPDATPLLVYEAVSQSIALRQLQAMVADESFGIQGVTGAMLTDRMARLETEGIEISESPQSETGVKVSLADASRVTSDFVLVRTTRNSMREFLQLFDWSAMGPSGGWQQTRLVVGDFTHPIITVYDERYRKCLDLEYDPASPYFKRGGVELPSGGLRAVERGTDGEESNQALRRWRFEVPVSW